MAESFSLLDVQARLETEGLYVSPVAPDFLWIALGSSLIRRSEIVFSKEFCTLRKGGEQWIASFPSNPPLTYEMMGSLPDLESLIIKVFHQSSLSGVPLGKAFSDIEPDSERYLQGAESLDANRGGGTFRGFVMPS